MIVVDTSALAAILLDEPEADRFRAAIAREEAIASAGSIIELALLDRVRRRDHASLMTWLAELGVEVVAIDVDQIAFALDGRDRFGRGRAAPPAVLNFGDLFAYALARSRGLGLLYKGEDFAMTDVRPAVS